MISKDETLELSPTIPTIREIIEMHQFFVKWFNGTCPHDAALFEVEITSHFSKAFQLVFPSGAIIPGDELFRQLWDGYGNSPGFAIQIRNIEVHELDPEGKVIFATYEEWMKNATYSKPSQSGRISTVIFEADKHMPNGLQWRHVHETWLPTAVTEADAFNF